MKNSIKRIWSFVLDILFPARCPWCDKVIGFDEACECSIALEAVCHTEREIYLNEQNRVQDFLQEAWACYQYEPPVSDAILRVKFDGDKRAATFLAKEMAQQAKMLCSGFDMVIPVPISNNTRKTRGYNQSFLLAGPVAEALQLPLHEDILLKKKETEKQMNLSRTQRLCNVVDAYTVQKKDVVLNKRILLIDDIFTTGATLNECAKTLLSNGAESCSALCAAVVDKKQ